MTPQDVADLRRTVRRLVEAASGEALEDARVLLEGHEAERDDVWAVEMFSVTSADGADPLVTYATVAQTPIVKPPTLAELAAARPRVTIPGRYCGDGHGVRIGRLVEDRDGMAQVHVDGFGVVNVPSAEVER